MVHQIGGRLRIQIHQFSGKLGRNLGMVAGRFVEISETSVTYQVLKNMAACVLDATYFGAAHIATDPSATCPLLDLKFWRNSRTGIDLRDASEY